MARVTLGNLATEARRSIGPVTWRTVRKDPTRPAPPLGVYQGGLTFARNRYGDFARMRYEPPYASTTAQQAVRNAIKQAVIDWQTGLTDAQRNAWNILALSGKPMGATSRRKPVCGYSLYIALDSYRRWTGLSILTSPPANLDVTQLSAFTITKAYAWPQYLMVTAAPALNLATEDAVIYTTPQISAGRLYCWQRTRKTALYSQSGAWPLDITDDYIPIWGFLTDGKRVGVQAHAWRKANSALGIRWQTSAVITSPGVQLLLNPDFETGAPGADAPNWTFESGQHLKIANDQVEHGLQSGKIINAAAANSYSRQDVGSLAPGLYTFQGWVRGDALAGTGTGAMFECISLPSGLNLITIHNNHPRPAHPTWAQTGLLTSGTMDQWLWCNMTFTLPPGETGIRTRIYLGMAGTLTGTAWYDYLLLCSTP
jgi:hypothetical protein